ncbi:MAG: hypothetical protein K8U03_14925 [Planctomycetia bacterium]|nr:hypothetical protein [Planctomycetia bacterium]
MRLPRWAFSFGAIVLVPVSFSLADPGPQFVANPYYSAAPAVVNRPPQTTQATPPAAMPARMTHTVYPTTETTFSAPPISSPASSPQSSSMPSVSTAPAAAPVVLRTLPRDEVAALRIAIQVPALNDAYQATTSSTIAYKQSPPRAAVFLPTSPSVEPARMAPTPDAARIPIPAPAMPIAASRAPNYRQDSAVRPVAWVSDTVNPSTSAGNPLRGMETNAAAVGNPLR